MATSKLSDCFKINFIHLKFFGIWRGYNSSKYYKYYSILFLFINSFTYNSLLILNLLFTPRKIDLIIREVIFLFTEVAVAGKVFMILLMRKEIFDAFNILDCEAFKGEDEASRQIVESHVSKYKTYWKIYAIISNFAYSSQVFLPIFVYLIFNTKMELPICKYYFLDDHVIRNYFVFWFIYQSVGMYGHMQYNVNIDTLIAGFLMMAIAQFEALNNGLKNLKVVKNNTKNYQFRDAAEIVKLNQHLEHYQQILDYCSAIQNIIGITMFVQFGIASVIICVILCGLLLPSSIEAMIFMVSYLFAMLLQIFVPAWLGTQLSHESQELVFAAYCSEWIPRSERFKRSLNVLMERAKRNIILTGWRLFPLSLDTFTSILKNAYSFFTLIRNVQAREI
ncbi:odorant receptor 2a-like [Vanessa tameamea]|uniref:Odorant receptor n=1 Tax=Vanessa tameamea TaxID=334116 RepID=A0A8B8IES0_VANTA|nr:odorant receptor 2a-like [Vanessa tameamea]